jgi:hypothetical protein
VKLPIPDPQTFRGAANIIRTNGWHQGGLYDLDVNVRRVAAGEPELPPSACPVCLIGAINVEATGETWDPEDVAYDVRLWVRELIGGAPGVWNDAPGRTVDEVLDLLERAAVAAESARAEAAQDGGAR